MNARKTFAWTAVWTGISAIIGVAAGILAVGSPPAVPVVHQTPAAVVQQLDDPTDTPNPTTTTEQPVTTTNDPAPTDTPVDTPPPATTTTTPPATTTSTVDDPRNPPPGIGPITMPEHPGPNTTAVNPPE